MVDEQEKKHESDEYTLGRDYVASARLALLHLLIKAQFGLLHPIIKDKMKTDDGKVKEGLRIADVGTGTGIWIGELSRELPASTQFDGFDISDAQYPPASWYGPNTTLSKLDIFKPLPEELVGKYDIVHLRFFMTVAKDSNIGLVLSNLEKMLKPGGHLQWVERDWLSKFPKTACETDDAHTQMTAFLHKWFNEAEWITNLPSHFASASLNVLAHQHETPLPVYRKPYNEDNLIGTKAVGEKITDPGQKEWFQGMLRQCVEEVARGWWVDFEIVIVVGRKAMVGE